MDGANEGAAPLDYASAASEAYGMSVELVRTHQQAAWVCLHQKPHTQPVTLDVTSEGGDQLSGRVALSWVTPTPDQLGSFADLQEATEWGATSIAMFLLHRLMGYRSFERSWKGTGFDYWMSKEAAVLMNGRDRLEVSGLLNGDSSRERARVKAKVKQMAKGGLPGRGFAAIINFGPPSVYFAVGDASESS